jgi:hypothetical protein
MFTIAVTATRDGLTTEQAQKFRAYVAAIAKKVATEEIPMRSCLRLVHGNCDGGDLELALIAYRLGVEVEAYPSDLPGAGRRIFYYNHATAVPRPPLERNERLVEMGNVVLAFPKNFHEELRSGTWHAIRAAKRRRRPLSIIWPNGTETTFNQQRLKVKGL